MTQKELLEKIKEPENSSNLLAEILDWTPDFNQDEALSLLQEAPGTKAILNKLTESEINALTEELVFIAMNSELQGFKALLDFIFILIGEKPIYNILSKNHSEIKA